MLWYAMLCYAMLAPTKVGSALLVVRARGKQFGVFCREALGAGPTTEQIFSRSES